jgi:hypothetical protein
MAWGALYVERKMYLSFQSANNPDDVLMPVNDAVRFLLSRCFLPSDLPPICYEATVFFQTYHALAGNYTSRNPFCGSFDNIPFLRRFLTRFDSGELLAMLDRSESIVAGASADKLARFDAALAWENDPAMEAFQENALSELRGYVAENPQTSQQLLARAAEFTRAYAPIRQQDDLYPDLLVRKILDLPDYWQRLKRANSGVFPHIQRLLKQADERFIDESPCIGAIRYQGDPIGLTRMTTTKGERLAVEFQDVCELRTTLHEVLVSGPNTQAFGRDCLWTKRDAGRWTYDETTKQIQRLGYWN